MLSTSIPRNASPVVNLRADTAQHSDLLADAVDAYRAEQASQDRYQELALAAEFKRRFKVQPEPARFHQRTSLSKSGVWTFRAAGLDWKAGINDDGSDRSIWFQVSDREGSFREASTKAQLGRLIEQGYQFEPAVSS